MGWNVICCAVDFDAPSRAAMLEAADLARRFGADLSLVHVLAPPTPAASDVLVASRELSRLDAERDEELLREWRAEAEARAGRRVELRLLGGDAAREIVRHAREARCDLVVIGSHGRTGLPRLVSGSIAERVVREAPCAVLVVHDGERTAERELAEELGQYV
jgi:nucleotide-binding universal stress UspA family protein